MCIVPEGTPHAGGCLEDFYAGVCLRALSRMGATCPEGTPHAGGHRTPLLRRVRSLALVHVSASVFSLWFGLLATRQRPAAHDTESDDDDFRDAAGGAGSAAKKSPAFAQVPPKPGAKRRGKENHNAHDSDDDFKAAPSKKGKKEAAKAPGQRGIGSFFAKGAAKPAGGPAEKDGTMATAGRGASEAKQDLVLSDKGVIPHYIASQLKAHQV